MSSLSSDARNLFQHPEPGDCIDIFLLDTRIHKGALATLFLARDQLSQQQVVLKIPCGDILNQPILLYHYQNEERISRFLDHPGIVRFIHRQRSRQYIIMEHIVGRDLRSLVGRNRSLPMDQALPLMLQLCAVVAYLHQQGIVHLDLKPENIICSQAGIKLIDFGLASCDRLPDLLTLDLRYPQGTPWYIAPEQLLGERADPRCDIYAMGMILYEMVSGQLPWPRSARVTVARRRLRHEPTPPRFYNRRIPAQLQDIILRAIARQPGDRYQRVADLQHDLSHWQQLPVTETGRNRRLPPFWKRFFPGRALRLATGAETSGEAIVPATRPQIIGAVLDAPVNDTVLTEVKKQALLHAAEITLVHVIEEESDSHVRRYGMVVEGEQLMARLEQDVQLLRRCSIDPCIRLIRGTVVEVLERLCRQLNPELLIIGKSRKTEVFSSKGSVGKTLKNNTLLPLLVAGEELFSASRDLSDLDPASLTPDQVLATDVFLVDLWHEHLRYHSDFIYDKLLHPEKKINLNENNCQLGRFLTALAGAEQWQSVRAQLEPIHGRFHQIARTMEQVGNQDHSRLQQLYVRESLPLSCHLKDILRKLSCQLRASLVNPPPTVPFLMDRNCPIGRPDLVCYGPLLRVFDLNQDLCDLIQGREAGAVNQEQN